MKFWKRIFAIILALSLIAGFASVIFVRAADAEETDNAPKTAAITYATDAICTVALLLILAICIAKLIKAKPLFTPDEFAVVQGIILAEYIKLLDVPDDEPISAILKSVFAKISKACCLGKESNISELGKVMENIMFTEDGELLLLQHEPVTDITIKFSEENDDEPADPIEGNEPQEQS